VSKVATQSFEHSVRLSKLQPHPKNPRKGNVAAIEDSIEANDFYGALVVQRSTGYILAGNHRYEAARKKGMQKLPVVWLDVDDDRALRILLADNRLNDVAAYDEAALAKLLKGMDDLTGTGWDEAPWQNFSESQRKLHRDRQTQALKRIEPRSWRRNGRRSPGNYG
jgi:hypothetical protein